MNLIFEAIKANNYILVRELIEYTPEVLTVENESSMTPLNFAISKGYIDIANLLLDAGIRFKKQAENEIIAKNYHAQKINNLRKNADIVA